MLNLDRRALLGIALAGVGSSLVGCGGGVARVPTASPTVGGGAATAAPGAPASVALPRTALLDAKFRVTDAFHPVHVVSPAFTLVAEEPGHVNAVTTYAATVPAPYVAIELDVDPAHTSGTAVAGVCVGDDGAIVAATWRPSNGEATLEVTAPGGKARVVGRTTWRGSGPVTLGFALCENQATVLVRSDDRWRALLTHRIDVATIFDARDPAMLAALRFVGGGRGDTRLTALRAGLFGMAGLRDPHVVQDADGTPYMRDGWVWLTWTCAGLGFFRQAHWAVFRMRLDDPTRIEEVAKVFSRRDGLVLGDHAGQLVRDGDVWRVAVSSWGDFSGAGVHVRHATTRADLLNGIHVLDTVPAALPTRLSSWDPSFTRIDGRWIVAYVESPSQSPFDFHPAVASTTDRDPFAALTLVARDGARHQTEGLILARDRTGWRLLASDGDAREYRVHDLSLRPLGSLDAPFGSNIPHAQVIPLPDGGWLLPTFDNTSLFADVVGYGAHGAVRILRAG